MFRIVEFSIAHNSGFLPDRFRNISVDNPCAEQKQRAEENKGQIEILSGQQTCKERPRSNAEAEPHRNKAHLSRLTTVVSQICCQSKRRCCNSGCSGALNYPQPDKFNAAPCLAQHGSGKPH